MTTNKLVAAADNGLTTQLAVGTAYTITTPIKLKLMATAGSDSAAGTEITAGGGYTAGGLTVVPSVSGGVGTITSAQWTNMPACTVNGYEVWDSSGTPKRLWVGDFGGAKTVNSGDTFTATSITLTLA